MSAKVLLPEFLSYSEKSDSFLKSGGKEYRSVPKDDIGQNTCLNM